ncbi:MAG: YIP1 family protein [bacterium]|nr:YIP1 family protein [bacterium]
MNDSITGRLADLFAKPGRLMDNVATRPAWWQPGLLVFLIMAAFTWVVSPIQGPEQMELMRDSKIMSMMPEDQWQQQYDEALDPAPMKRAITAVGSGFTSWVMILVFGFILGFFARMGGGQGTFKQALGVVSWSSLLPFGVGVLIKLPLVLVTESVATVSVGLAALAPGLDPMSPLFQILNSYGDFFTWWGLFVLVVGFQRVFNMSRGAAAVAVLLPWALLTAIPVGLTLLFM